VRLIATDDPDLSVSGWTWNATYSFSTVAGQKLAIPTHSFAVPSDGVVDLTTVVKVPSSAGIGTEQAEALAASAQAAAIQSAQDAAIAAQAAVDAADAAQVTDVGIATLVANPASDTADAVAALVNTAAADKLGIDDAINTFQSQAALDSAAAAKVGSAGTSLNSAVKAIADNAAGPKLDAATAATTYAAKSVETTKLDAATAVTTYAGIADVNTPTVRFDQFPVALTDTTTVNSAVTNQSVATAGGWVFSVFFGSDMNPYIARVRDGQSSWQVFNLGALPGNPLVAPAPKDEHNNIAIAVDGDGFIHVSGNHHRVPLNYVRSTVAYEITGWETPGMIGTDETEVTYPDFKKDAAGNLLFFYRAGTSADGDLMLNKYTTATKTWSRVGLILKGHAWGTPTAEYDKGSYSAYPARVVLDTATGKTHIWWNWRGTITADSNQDLHYAYTPDNGATWKDKSGANLTLPILPTTTATRIFAGKLNHAVQGACVDSSGNPHLLVRFSAPTDEMRHYWIAGGTVSSEVVGTSAMGDNTIFGTTDGKVYAVYTSAQVWLKQLSPTQGTPVRIFQWTVYNYRPSFDPDAMLTDTLRLMVTPSRAKAGGTYGGVLTMQVTPTTIAAVAAGSTLKARPIAPAPIVDPVRLVPGSYPMVPGMFYGPAGPRANTPSTAANGTFKGQIITAAKAGKIVECSVSVVTAGAAGAKVRFVIYRPDGKLVAQSADVDVTVTGTRSAAISANIGKNEQYIVGTIQHSSTGASAVMVGSFGAHDSRVALGNAASYYSAIRAGFQILSAAIPAVDQAVDFLNPAAGASVGTADAIPSVVIKVGDMPADWSTGSE